MLHKSIVWFGRSAVIICDGRCDRAYGINGRPKKQLGPDVDDYVWQPDSALPEAPGPGDTATISEGSDMKPSAEPLDNPQRMNRWCARECERSTICEPTDMEHPTPNMPHLHAHR